MRNWFAIVAMCVIACIMLVLCLVGAAMFAGAGCQWMAGACFVVMAVVLFSSATVIMDVYYYNFNERLFNK